MNEPRSSLLEEDGGCICPSGKLLFYDKSKQNMQHKHGIFPYMFDCWTDPVVHLLLLKSSMNEPNKAIQNLKWFKLERMMVGGCSSFAFDLNECGN